MKQVHFKLWGNDLFTAESAEHAEPFAEGGKQEIEECCPIFLLLVFLRVLCVPCGESSFPRIRNRPSQNPTLPLDRCHCFDILLIRRISN
jgi:hypothetical protein